MSDTHKADPVNKEEENSPKMVLQKRPTGNLLIDEPPSSPSSAENKKGPKVTLARRITDRLMAPAPPLEETEELDF
jgi:hypothetical protein